MATRAFLLCGDEKAVQAVTQILDELEVSFEHSSEPAFSLKRLATQRFDLLIVDCDNVQNATQVFNSARASNLNKVSIAIAIVEGKAGVPNAFRLGASLVLTKPVSLEQARNTLRTGIGMARKDTQEVKAPVSAAPVLAPGVHPAAVPTVPAPPAAMVSPAKAPQSPAAPAAAATPVPARPAVAPPILTPVAPLATPVPTPPVTAMPKATFSAIPVPEKPVPAPPHAVSTPAAQVSEPKSMLNVEAKIAEPKAPELKAAELKTSELKSPELKLAEAKPAPSLGSSAIAKAASASAAVPAVVKNFDSVFATPAVTEKSEKAAPPKLSETKSSEDSKLEPSIPALSIVDPLAEDEALDPIKDHGVPSFGGMGSQSFAGLETSTRSRGRGALIAAVIVLLLGVAGYAAWLTQPEFRKAVALQYLNATTKVAGLRGQSQPAAAVKPVPSPAPAEPAPAPVAIPSSNATEANPASLPNSVATPSSTPTTNATPNAPNSPTSSSSAPSTDTASKTATVQNAKQDTTHPAGNPALVAASATVPATAAPKNSGSDLLEVPEDYADDQVVHRVHPSYPKQARARKLQGTVVLQAIINKQGKVDSLQLVSGDALLAQAAADAVKQWRYKPYLHNGDASDFQTRVTVDFKLP